MVYFEQLILLLLVEPQQTLPVFRATEVERRCISLKGDFILGLHLCFIFAWSAVDMQVLVVSIVVFNVRDARCHVSHGQLNFWR